MYGIDFHADDYAASIENSKRILTLMREGKIDSASVMTNMGCFDVCMDLLRQAWDELPRKPLLSVHLNLIDGYWLSSGEKKEIIEQSWAGIFLHNLLPGRKRWLERYSAEIEAQISTFLAATEGLRDDAGSPIEFRVDSHVHTHMIPLVFEAMMKALDAAGVRARVRFIRCSTESLACFLFTPGIAGTISPVSLLKNRTLHMLSYGVRRKLRRAEIPTGRIFGIAMTGEMDQKRVQILLPKMRAYAKRKDAYLEIMSHPGRALPQEISGEYGPDDRKAFLSPGRDTEFEMLMKIQR